jgi:hypothetical protein
LTIKAVISDLLNKTDFANATRVILSGEMEGGLAAFELADFFSETIHWADVKAVPIGGFYFPQNLARLPPNRRPKRYDNMPPAINSHVHDVFQSYTNIHCRNKNQNRPHLCGPANVGYLYPYIQTPLFIAQNQYDFRMLLVYMICPPFQGYYCVSFTYHLGAMMREEMKRILASPKKDGLWGAACYDDTVLLRMFDGVNIDGTRMVDAIGNWYFHHNIWETQFMDTCEYPNCNAYCFDNFRP